MPLKCLPPPQFEMLPTSLPGKTTVYFHESDSSRWYSFIQGNFETEKAFSTTIQARHLNKTFCLECCRPVVSLSCANSFPNFFRGEEFSCQVEGTLAAESSLIVLDALELMIQVRCYFYFNPQGSAFFQNLQIILV